MPKVKCIKCNTEFEDSHSEVQVSWPSNTNSRVSFDDQNCLCHRCFYIEAEEELTKALKDVRDILARNFNYVPGGVA